MSDTLRKSAMSYHVNVAANGRLVLPAAVRRKLGLDGAGRLAIIENEDGSMVIKTMSQVVADLQREVRELIGDRPGFSVDEFLAERRAEAARENAKLP